MPLKDELPKIANRKTRVFACHDLPSQRIDLYGRQYYDVGGVRQIRTATSVLFEAELSEGVIQPMLRLELEEAQELLQSLWDCGLRPRVDPMPKVDMSASLENELKARHAAALERHLEDMRKLVFSKDGAPTHVRRLDPEVYEAVMELDEDAFGRWLDRIREARRAAGSAGSTHVKHGGRYEPKEFTDEQIRQMWEQAQRETSPDRRNEQGDPDPITKTEEAIRKEYFARPAGGDGADGEAEDEAVAQLRVKLDGRLRKMVAVTGFLIVLMVLVAYVMHIIRG